MTEDGRKGYLEQLQTESMMSGAAMDASDIKKVELFYAEIDAANKAQQASNRIVAEEAAREQNKDRVAPNYTPEEIRRMELAAGPGGAPMGTFAPAVPVQPVGAPGASQVAAPSLNPWDVQPTTGSSIPALQALWEAARASRR
jgi:hypothetical protein